jgi:hypothetical protein
LGAIFAIGTLFGGPVQGRFGRLSAGYWVWAGSMILVAGLYGPAWRVRWPQWRDRAMGEQENTRVVRELFEAFGRGDAAGLLDRVADDIEWRIAAPSDVEAAGTYRGKDEVAQMLQALARDSEFEVFEPREFIAQGETVVVLGRERQRVKATGRVAEAEWAMAFTIRDGKVARFRHYIDNQPGAGR